jgi:hypothetical protein
VVTIEEADAVEVAEATEAEAATEEAATEEAAIEVAQDAVVIEAAPEVAQEVPQEEMAHQLNSENETYHLLIVPLPLSLLVAKTSDFSSKKSANTN